MDGNASVKYSKLPVIMDARFDTTQIIYVLDEYPKKEDYYKYNVFSKYNNSQETNGFDLKYLVYETEENKTKMRIEYMSNNISETPEKNAVGLLYSLMDEIEYPILYDIDQEQQHFFRYGIFGHHLTYIGIDNQVAGSGKSSPQKLKEYITILGRKRLIHKQGRSKFIKYQGTLMKVKDAKILDKKTIKNKK